MRDHFAVLFETMREARVGPGTGYPSFYRDSEVIQHLRDVVHNLNETFGDVSIPGVFASPHQLVDTWVWFHAFLKDRDGGLFDDVFKHLNLSEDEQRPYWLTRIHHVHKDVEALLEEIRSMPEVKGYISEHEVADEEGGHAQELSTRCFDVVVITALHDTEFEALRRTMAGFTRHLEKDDPTDYWEGMVANKRVLLATDDRMGMAAAASLTTKIIAKFCPRYVIMAGIAAAVKDNEKAYGDILVTRQTWN